MQPIYNPRAWFWLAEDGRLFSSAAMALIADADPSYTAWTALGGVATVWPRDAAGEQTQQGLDAVLTAAGVSPVTGPTITNKADLFRRCTDEEAEAIEMALAAQSVRKRRIFEMAAYISSDDPDFADLRTAAVEMFGAKRAAELLAAS
jgi:hypothetical protein